MYRYTIAGRPQYNKISQFQDSRYVSAAETLHGVFHFDIIALAPTVLQLDEHLENNDTFNISEDCQLSLEYENTWKRMKKLV